MGFRLANVAGRAVLVHGDGYHDLETASGGSFGPDPMEAVARFGDLAPVAETVADREATGLLADADLRAPVPRPAQVFAIGLNYRNHAEEGGMELPEVPMVFTKFPSSIAPPNVTIEVSSNFVDYEGELVAVIGTGGRNIAAADAWGHVAGLSIGQDVSDRAVQFASTPAQFSMGKSFDTYGPVGPAVVSLDELDDHTALGLVCELNGEVRQSDSTGDLIFGIPTLIEYLSHITTLRAGDLIFTGTPGGVGASSGRFLRDGDVLTTSIDGLGTIVNRCVRTDDHPHASMIPAAWRPKD